MSHTIELDSKKEWVEVDDFDELDDFDADPVIFTSSYYLQNKKEIEAIERFIFG